MFSRSVPLTDDEIEKAVHLYANRLFKLCFLLLGNHADAEDAVSDTFYRYITKSPNFQEEEHRKAWLFKVAKNICQDVHRLRKRNQPIHVDDLSNYCTDEKDILFLEEIMSFPAKYKTVLHLFYIEGYKTNEIAQILSISSSAVRKRLQYAREKLKLDYGKENER